MQDGLERTPEVAMLELAITALLISIIAGALPAYLTKAASGYEVRGLIR